MPAERQAPLMLRSTLIALLVIGGLAFAALLALMAYAPDLRGKADPGAHALSRSAVGYAGLVRLLQSGRANVHVSRGADELIGARLVILTPEAPISKEAWAQRDILSPTLIVLPKWIVAPNPSRAGWVLKAGMLGEDFLSEMTPFIGEITIVRRQIRTRPSLVAAASANPQGAPLRLGAIESFQTISGKALTPRVVDEENRVVLAQWGDEAVYVLSDPDLLNTKGIADFQTARAAADLIDSISVNEGPIIFDATLNGFERARNPLRLALEPPFLAVTLCLLAAGLLAGWQAMVRFGPAAAAERAFDYGKKALADNSAALIRLARRDHEMGESYAQLTRDLAARAIGAPRAMKDEELAAHLDRVAKQAGAEGSLAALTSEARESKSRAGLIGAARALYRWRRGVMRADR